MAEEKKKRKQKPQRQQWKPHWTLSLLHKLWMAAFALVKIALGAAATVAIICVVCLLVFAGILGDYLEADVLPNSVVVLEEYGQDQASTMYYWDNGEIQLLQNLYAKSNSKWADLEDIPEDMINATIAIEDKRFHEHQGVDWITTVKACVGMFIGSSDAGGSTITQQLVKNLTGEKSVTVQRKVLEWFRAFYVETHYDKDTILEHYLNRIYLGQGCYGVRSAAAVYFGKEVEMLTPAECASLIAITNNPSFYDPYGSEFEIRQDGELVMTDGVARNRMRQEDVLWAMKEQGLLTQEEYEQAWNQELVFKDGIDDMDRMTSCDNEECDYRAIASTFTKDGNSYYCPQCGTKTNIIENASKSVYSWFVDSVYEDVAQALCEKDGLEWNYANEQAYKDLISRSGLHIYTTLDMDVQNQIDKIYTDLKQIPTARSGQQLQSAIVVIDNSTGYIVGMAGGVGEKEVHDAYNRAEAKLQTGSSIKPISVYAPAFESGAFSPASVVKDMPLYYKPTVFPRNDSRTYSYSRTVYSAIVNSINGSAVDVLNTIGLSYSYDFAKNKFGLKSLTDYYVNSYGTEMSDEGFAPLALGAQTFGVSVREMASAFATFANEGVYREGITYTKVYDSDGNLILENKPETREILSSKTVDYVNYCLYNATLRGTGTAADLDGQDTAGKTGTTGDSKDRWYCGYTHYYTAAVWCGYDTPEVIKLTGSNRSNPAARLFKKVMNPIHKGLKRVSLYSSKLKAVNVCLDSGMLATDACRLDARTDLERVNQVRAYPADFPEMECTKHVLVDVGEGCDGVCNEYCYLFAEANQLKLKQKALVKMTQEEVNEILAAEKYKLKEDFFRDDYVYLIDKDGKDASWTGFHGKCNKDVNAPYKVCSVHTEAAWQAYQDSIAPPETKPPVVEDPGSPSVPAVPDTDTGDAGADGGQ